MWLVDDPELQDDWFCEPAKDGGWDCVQDPQRVANPRPARLPEPLFARERAFPAATNPPGRALPPPASASEPRPASPGRRAPPPDDDAIPLYQRLAFEPERPMALVDLPRDYYAIQLIALSSPQDLERFVIENDLPPMSGAVVERDGHRYFALLAGIYVDRETAERAAQNLPEVLRAHGPWLRSVESLQAAIRRAEQLPDEAN